MPDKLSNMEFDIFISHASEDKDDLVRPLAEQLRQRGLRVWFDETELKLGDSLRRSIDYGLSKSSYGLVILSPDFLKKEWTQKELDGLVAREDGTTKVILPIWHNLNRIQIAAYSPTLADKLAAPTSKGLAHVVEQIVRAVAPLDANRVTDNTRPQQVPEQHQSHGIHTLIVQMLDRIVELADCGSLTVTGVPTGFRDLDHLTAGLQAESLTILAGRPSVGKTTFALNIADHVGCNEGLPILIFSPTESAAHVTNRIVCASGRIEPSHLRVGLLTDEEWPRLTEALERLRDASIHIHDASELSVESVRAECFRLLEEHGALGLVIIDSLRFFGDTKGKEDDPDSVCRRLKSLAREIKAPILVISDLSRAAELRVDKRPMLSDLNEIDRNADLVLFLYREVMHRMELAEPDIAEVIVAKQRDGSPLGTVRLSYSCTVGKFENLVPINVQATE